MKKTLLLPRYPYLINRVERGQFTILQPSLTMRNAQQTNLKLGNRECAIQEFDARYAYLFSFEVSLPFSQTFLIHATLSDLHHIYLLDAKSSVTIRSNDSGKSILKLDPFHSCISYLPEGSYRVRLPKGRTHIFGYYFDNQIFRQGNERKFEFIKDLIKAPRDLSQKSACSENIPIDTRTNMFIRNLCENLKKELQNEPFVLEGIVRLMELAREKFYELHTKTSHNYSLAEKARKLIDDHVLLYGNDFSFNSIYDILGYKKTTVHRVHQTHFRSSLLSYKQQLLLEKATILLEQGESVKNCAYTCGYNSMESFNRFFKSKTGKSPSEFIKTHNSRKRFI